MYTHTHTYIYIHIHIDTYIKTGDDVIIQRTGNSQNHHGQAKFFVQEFTTAIKNTAVRNRESGQVYWFSLNTNYSAARMAMS